MLFLHAATARADVERIGPFTFASFGDPSGTLVAVLSQSPPGLFVAFLGGQNFAPQQLKLDEIPSSTPSVFALYNQVSEKWESLTVPGDRTYKLKGLVQISLSESIVLTIDGESYATIEDTRNRERPWLLSLKGNVPLTFGVGFERLSYLKIDVPGGYEPYTIGSGRLSFRGQQVSAEEIGLQLFRPDRFCHSQGAVIISDKAERLLSAKEFDPSTKGEVLRTRASLEDYYVVNTTERSTVVFDPAMNEFYAISKSKFSQSIGDSRLCVRYPLIFD